MIKDPLQIQQLQENEEKYRSLFETMAFGVVYQDINGNIISANHAAEKILGLSFNQMKRKASKDPKWKNIQEDGTDFPDEIHPARVALKTGKTVKDVVMGVFDPKKEETRWIKINATPQFKNNETKAYQVYTTFEDITERKQSEDKQEKLSKQLQLALEAANMGWWHYNPITDISTYDNRYKEIFGVLGSKRPNEEILKLLHPDDLPGVWANVEEALDPINPKKYFVEYRIYRNNEIRWIEAYGIASFEGYGKAKHAVSLVGTVNDITERKRSEKYQQELLEREQQLTEELRSSNEESQSTAEKLQVTNEELRNQEDQLLKTNKALSESAALLDNSYEAIFSWDYEKGILSWNQGAERLYGYTSREAIGQVSHDFLKPNFQLNSMNLLKD